MTNHSQDPFFELPQFTAPTADANEVAPISYEQAVAFFEEMIEAYHRREHNDDRDSPCAERFTL